MQQALLKWFRRNARPLPWRRHYRPYEVWISEVMLQQTRVETALPYYRRWMRRFPDVRALARASERDVLKSWEGLGYYSRARNLHASARAIVERHGGVFPRRFEDLRALKGIGPYSAGAIASIAYNEPRPIVDGNVLRVLARYRALSDPIDVPRHRERYWALQESLIPDGHARDFNQALMELGALVCVPRDPRCGVCPLRAGCEGLRSGDPERFPVRGKRPRIVPVHAAALILERGGRFYLQRRPDGGLMGGLWEFPEWKLSSGRLLSRAEAAAGVRRAARREFGAGLEPRRVATLKRHYTRYAETMEVFRCEWPGRAGVPRGRGWRAGWISPGGFARVPFTSAHARIGRLAAGG